MPLTQANRSLRIATPLGQDVLLLESFTGTEQISRLFQFELVLVSENENIKPSDLLGQNVTVSVLHSDEQTERYFNGFISRFTQLPSEHRLARYHAEMVPWFWFLTQTANCSIFQEKTVPEIVEEVFKTFGFSDYEIAGIGGGHERWEYCVWYRETAFNFCSRLLEQEGIFYFFRHENGKHTLVLADQRSAHKPCDDPNSKVPMAPSEGPGAFRGAGRLPRRGSRPQLGTSVSVPSRQMGADRLQLQNPWNEPSDVDGQPYLGGRQSVL